MHVNEEFRRWGTVVFKHHPFVWIFVSSTDGFHYHINRDTNGIIWTDDVDIVKIGLQNTTGRIPLNDKLTVRCLPFNVYEVCRIVGIELNYVPRLF